MNHETAITEAPVPGTDSRAEHRRERTREQILEAARSALIRIGYERITTRDIAKEAGVNIATLHYYFGTKEALLSETVQFAMSQTLGEVHAVIQDAPDAATALERAFQVTWRLVKERPGVLRYDLFVRGIHDPEAHRQVTAIYESLHGLVGEILERHTSAGNRLHPSVNVELLRHYLVASIDGVILQHLVFHDDEKTIGCLHLILQQAKHLLMTDSDPSREP